MCGIIIMMSNSKMKGAVDRGKAFTQGIIVDTFRGQHSTGLDYVDYSGNAEVYKKPVPGYDFVHLPKYQEIIRDPEDYPFLIAHNRYATQGKINTANAHPFQHGAITGVHNGSLFAYRNLAIDEHFGTDSEYIIHALAYNNTEDVLKEIDGAFTLVWHDSLDNTLHVIRNSERPFYIAHIKDSETVFGASELEMLDLICYRNNLVIEESYQIKENCEFIFSVDDLHNPKTIEREVLPYYPITTSYGGDYCQYGGNSRSNPSTDADDGAVTGKYTRGTLDRGFIRYSGSSNSKYGYISCMGVEEPYEAIRIQGLQENEWAALDTKDGYFEGIITAKGKDGDESYLSISLEVVKWLDEGEAYEGFDYMEQRFTKEEKGEANDSTNPKLQSQGFAYVREGKSCTRAEADRMLSCGCGICGNPIELSDFNDLEWWNDSPICVDCILDDSAAPFIRGI